MAENKVIPMYSKISLAELFVNMNRTQHDFNKEVKNCLLQIDKKQKVMQAFIVALTLTIITMGLGFILAMNKIKSEPMTVYIDGQRETVDINELPLAPLEELKWKKDFLSK